MTAASIMVEENQAVLGENLGPIAGCCKPFPIMLWEKASISPPWPHRDFMTRHKNCTSKKNTLPTVYFQKFLKVIEVSNQSNDEDLRFMLNHIQQYFLNKHRLDAYYHMREFDLTIYINVQELHKKFTPSCLNMVRSLEALCMLHCLITIIVRAFYCWLALKQCYGLPLLLAVA